MVCPLHRSSSRAQRQLLSASLRALSRKKRRIWTLEGFISNLDPSVGCWIGISTLEDVDG